MRTDDIFVIQLGLRLDFSMMKTDSNLDSEAPVEGWFGGVRLPLGQYRICRTLLDGEVLFLLSSLLSTCRNLRPENAKILMKILT